MITADEFLKVAKLYQLGFLDTEKPHPRTMQLSEWARGDLTKAISVLIGIDIDALDVVKKKAADIARLRSAILNARSAGGRIFLCGCGATGRLSLLLETLFRQTHAGDESVVAF